MTNDPGPPCPDQDPPAASLIGFIAPGRWTERET